MIEAQCLIKLVTGKNCFVYNTIFFFYEVKITGNTNYAKIGQVLLSSKK